MQPPVFAFAGLVLANAESRAGVRLEAVQNAANSGLV